MYENNFQVPLYSSLVVGQWDTLTQAGGDNTELFGLYKTVEGVIVVGRQKADTLGNAVGNNIPVYNVTPWGNASPSNESAILVYYKANNLYNPNDNMGTTVSTQNPAHVNEFVIYPNPFAEQSTIYFEMDQKNTAISLYDLLGNQISQDNFSGKQYIIERGDLSAGVYFVKTVDVNKNYYFKKVVIK